MAPCFCSSSFSSSRHTSCSGASSSRAPADTDLFPSEDENEQENEQDQKPPQVPMGAYLEFGDEPLLIASPPLPATSDDADVRLVPLLAPLAPAAAVNQSTGRQEPTATLNDLLNCESGRYQARCGEEEECPICKERMQAGDEVIIHQGCGNGLCQLCLLLWVDERRKQRLPATCPFCRTRVVRRRTMRRRVKMTRRELTRMEREIELRRMEELALEEQARAATWNWFVGPPVQPQLERENRPESEHDSRPEPEAENEDEDKHENENQNEVELHTDHRAPASHTHYEPSAQTPASSPAESEALAFFRANVHREPSDLDRDYHMNPVWIPQPLHPYWLDWLQFRQGAVPESEGERKRERERERETDRQAQCVPGFGVLARSTASADATAGDDTSSPYKTPCSCRFFCGGECAPKTAAAPAPTPNADADTDPTLCSINFCDILPYTPTLTHPLCRTTFCAGCLQRWGAGCREEGRSVTCPVDRQVIVLPWEWKDWLNLGILVLMCSLWIGVSLACLVVVWQGGRMFASWYGVFFWRVARLLVNILGWGWYVGLKIICWVVRVVWGSLLCILFSGLFVIQGAWYACIYWLSWWILKSAALKGDTVNRGRVERTRTRTRR